MTTSHPDIAADKVAKERPLLFSGAMVRALLAGTKTQTRRTVKPQPAPGQGMVNAAYCRAPHLWLRDGPCDESDPAYEWSCPYGQPGDRLWVRESFSHIYGDNVRPTFRCPEDVAYMADGFTVDVDAYGAWKPSIHMPRWACRILLEITEVRVERLQDISEADAIAEGIEPNWSGDLKVGPNGFGGEGWVPDCGWRHYLNSLDGEPAYTPIESYSTLWRAINGDGAWDRNEWVWVIQFRRIHA